MNVLDHALALLRAGVSVIPILADGTKKPAVAWKPHQSRLASEEEARRWWGGPRTLGIAAVCGEVSGGLELIDFDRDTDRTYPDWCRLVEESCPGLLERLVVVRTPRRPVGGMHVWYRFAGVRQGNQKLAGDPAAPGDERTLIETRGEGGYALVPGGPDAVHASGVPYEYLAESLADVPTITADDREFLLAAARSFDRSAPSVEQLPKSVPGQDLRPGEDFERRGSWEQVLGEHRWTLALDRGGVQYWCRPGKGKSWSATVGHCKGADGAPLLRVFSTNADPFAPEKAYGLFRAYALLNFSGDLSRAASFLRSQGYGSTGFAGSGKRQPKPAAKPETVEEDPDETVVVRASTVKRRKVEWLWLNRVPLGKLTTFAGIGGLGKTFVLCDMTARVTSGRAWPDGQAGSTAARVLFVSGEDEPDDTLVPRMAELGADLDLVFFLADKALARFTLAHLPMLDKAMIQAGENVRMVVIDPPTAYLAGVDDHKNSELRMLLSPLKEWAAKWRTSVVFNTHVNKGGAGKVEAMMRVMGSVAWVNAVRAAHMFARDPEDPDRVLFVPMKQNLGPRRNGLAYRIAAVGELATVEWLGEVDTTADQAMAGRKGPTRKAVATEWLVGMFREKLEWPSDDLFKAAREAGVSRDAVFEAKKSLDLPKARKTTTPAGDTVWHWWVPANWGALKEQRENSKAGTPAKPPDDESPFPD